MNRAVAFGGARLDRRAVRAFDASRVVSSEFERTRNAYVEDFSHSRASTLEVSASMAYKMVGRSRAGLALALALALAALAASQDTDGTNFVGSSSVVPDDSATTPDDTIDPLNAEAIVTLTMIEDPFRLDGADWSESSMDDASRDVTVDDATVLEVLDLAFHGGSTITSHEHFPRRFGPRDIDFVTSFDVEPFGIVDRRWWDGDVIEFSYEICDGALGQLALAFTISFLVLLGLYLLTANDDDEECECCRRGRRCGTLVVDSRALEQELKLNGSAFFPHTHALDDSNVTKQCSGDVEYECAKK